MGETDTDAADNEDGREFHGTRQLSVVSGQWSVVHALYLVAALLKLFISKWCSGQGKLNYTLQIQITNHKVQTATDN